MIFNRTNILTSLLALITPQIIAFLLDKSSGAAFLLGVILIVAYQVYERTINYKEVAIGSATALASGLAMAFASKNLVYDSMCQISEGLQQTQTSSLINSESVCLTTQEIFLNAITANPLQNWYFWIVTLGTASLSIALYREYKEN